MRAISSLGGAVLLAVVVAAVYSPGLSGGFYFDDSVQIINNPSIAVTGLDAASLLRAARSTHTGPLGRPVSLASFAVNYHFTGLDPYYFKLTNVAIHVATAVGVLWLLRLLLLGHREVHGRPDTDNGIAWIALAGATLWALHPLNMTAILYVVQRMTSLSGLFSVCGMIAYCAGRLRMLRGRSGYALIVLGTGAFGLVGMLAKENAALMFGYLLVAEATIFGFAARRRWDRPLLGSFFGVTFGLPVVAFFAYVIVHPEWLAAMYYNRDFDLWQRLLTEARILWTYLALIFVPNIGKMAMFHDQIVVSTGWFVPPSTVFAVTGHLGLIAVALLVRRKAPILSLGILWFYVGHAAEGTIIPLELMFEHRNYLPMLGPIFALTYYLIAGAPMIASQRLRGALCATLLAVCAAATTVRAAQFGDYWGFALHEARRNPNSSRTTHEAGRMLITLMLERKTMDPELYADAVAYLDKSIAADPNTLNPLFTALFLEEVSGEPVPRRFVEELIVRLRSVPPPNALNVLFVAFFRQLADDKLHLPREDAIAVFEAALANPLVGSGRRADVMTGYALYELYVLGQVSNAVDLAERAYREDPTRADLDMILAIVYLAADRRPDAIRHLTLAEQRDNAGFHREELTALRRELTTR